VSFNDNTERGLETAEALEHLQRENALARIRNNLAGLGEEFCIGCGERIEDARRMALPSAKRCIYCQTILETGK
jgi:phage/conjugal plasmid C-4 type zinc finger TraR family protein